MPQVLGADNIPNPVVASTTSLTLAATNKNLATAYTIGGQQYSNTATLTLSTATTGAGGLDTGTLGAIQLWYIYAIRSLSTFLPALIASQAGPVSGPAMPSGYGTAWALVGAFYTNGSSQVASICTINGTATTKPIIYPMGFTGAPVSSSSAAFERMGASARLTGFVTVSGAATASFAVSLPSGLNIDINGTIQTIGSAQATKSAVGYTGVQPVINNATTLGFTSISGALNVGSGGIPFTWANADSLSYNVIVPISNWTPTLF